MGWLKRPNPGSRGGIVSSMRLTVEQRRDRATRAGNALLLRYGVAYYSAIGKLSKKKIQNA